MNEEKAREILGAAIRPDNSLSSLGPYIGWAPGDADICLDADFTVDELEALTWWLRNKSK